MPTTPCPYCGLTPETENATRCTNCNGLFEVNSRKATQLAMGPWFIRDENRPFMPGFNTAILREQAKAGRIKADTIVRGPTTNQFWMRADHVPGLSRLLGKCHFCEADVSPTDQSCTMCQADLSLPETVNTLGLSYVEPDERARVQEELNEARRAAAGPAPAPKPAANPNPSNAGKPLIVDAELLKPIDSPADTAEAETYEEAAEEPAFVTEPDSVDYAPSQPASVDIAEDLWHTTGSAPAPRRRRRRNNEPDPLVIGMGVLLFVVITGGLILLVTSTGDSDDENNPIAGTAGQNDRDEPALPTRTLEQVATVRDLVVPRFEMMRKEEVPAELGPRVKGIGTLIDQAKAYEGANQLSQAYQQYKRSLDLIGPLEKEIAGWSELQEARDSVVDLVERVESIRAEAEEAEAQKWAANAWNEAEFEWNKVEPLIRAGQYTEAATLLSNTESMFRMTLGRATTAKSATDARETLLKAMSSGFSEQTLRQSAGALFDEFLSLRAEAERSFEAGQFEDAEGAFNDAVAMFDKARKSVELARYATFYACEAGFKAAGVMLGVASGSGIEAQTLTDLSDAYEKLGLSPIPSRTLQAGEQHDFGKVADAVVYAARDAITSTRGQEVQACYLAGFHMRIIDQTLKSVAYDDDKQKRVHQSLGVIEEQARAAGWDTSVLANVIEQVRTANRTAKTGSPPTAVLDLWQKMYRPFTDRDRAVRILDPVKFPGKTEDPELFPGLG